jgi:hypothetical protein
MVAGAAKQVQTPDPLTLTPDLSRHTTQHNAKNRKTTLKETATETAKRQRSAR